MERSNEPERLLRLKEVQRITGLCRSAIYQRIKEDSFPLQVQLGEGSRAVGWAASEVFAWVERQIRAAHKATPARLSEHSPARQVSPAGA